MVRASDIAQAEKAVVAAGHPVRALGLPRDALLNLIVRGNQAIPPRGSTRVEAGDRLHILVRQEVAIEFRSLLDRWRSGPLGPPPRPRPRPRSAPTIFVSRPWTEADDDQSRPDSVDDLAVIEQLRTRRISFAKTDAERAWWREVIGALAAP